MKASKFSDAQKAFVLKQGSDGVPVADICRKAGISQATHFNWTAWVSLPPTLDHAAPEKSGFIRGSAGRGCRAADEALSAFCRRASYADERRYSLYAKPRIFVAPRRG